ncbi:uncharacterized protein E0L32_009855 [Thyridium curvatum]|uniref:F-box domain-containing protein n=1 Tax=Thyridium curvatum TaxID=1093900 RepID=A0A507APL4_9PEZI|nr:uncharacterized protein E0L32_009855 [Thyridium curvatum]TPX08666.1 hypothetical protein E0L32_009855 [Thyridium curvatum]
MSTQDPLDTMDKQNGCGLATLPVELIMRITYTLTTSDLSSLRLTCKRITDALSSQYIREFFTKKQFMLSEFSLKALVDISKHEAYSQSLTHVIFGLDHFELQDAGTRDLSSEQLTEYRAGHAEQQYLISSSRGQLLLVEAFRNLPRLETIDIRDFSSNRRSRDGPTRKWCSYGAPTICKKTGRELTTSGYPRGDFASKTFALVLAAAAEAGVRLSKLEVICRNKTWGLTDFAFYVPPALEPAYDSVLAGIRVLNLDLYPGLGLDFGRITNPEEYRVATVMLKKFLRRTTNVTHLRLNLQHASHTAAQTLIEWIGHPDPDSDDPLFPALDDLSLGSLEVKPETIVSLLNKFPKLTSVGLRRMVLIDASADDVRGNVWLPVVNRLAKLEELKHVHLGFMRQRKEHGVIIDVSLFELAKRPGPTMKIYAASLEGDFYGSPRRVREWLLNTAREMYVQWPPEIEDADELDEDDGDGEGSDEEHDSDGDDDGNGDDEE